jgi:hypothetical protein
MQRLNTIFAEGVWVSCGKVIRSGKKTIIERDDYEETAVLGSNSSYFNLNCYAYLFLPLKNQ